MEGDIVLAFRLGAGEVELIKFSTAIFMTEKFVEMLQEKGVALLDSPEGQESTVALEKELVRMCCVRLLGRGRSAWDELNKALLEPAMREEREDKARRIIDVLTKAGEETDLYLKDEVRMEEGSLEKPTRRPPSPEQDDRPTMPSPASSETRVISVGVSVADKKLG